MTAERLAYDAVHLPDTGRPCDAELVQSKLVGNVAAGVSLRNASALHSGYAARTDHPITRLIRDIQLVGAPAGPDDVQRYRLSEKAAGADRIHDGHPPGVEPLISDARQSGSSPRGRIVGVGDSALRSSLSPSRP